MVTDVALDACQVSVTLCPVLIEVELAESVMVGATFGLELPHEIEPQTANREAPQEIQRKDLLIIRKLRGLSGRDRARIRCWGRPGGCRYKGETIARGRRTDRTTVNSHRVPLHSKTLDHFQPLTEGWWSRRNALLRQTRSAVLQMPG